MKITIDMTPARTDGSVGGVMNLCMEIIKGLSIQDNVEVLLLCAYWNKDFLRENIPSNVRLFEIINNNLTGTGISMLVRKVKMKLGRGKKASGILRQNKVDLLFCPFSAPTYKVSGIPAISTINDIQHEYYPQFFAAKENRHRRRFYKDVAKKVDGVICISDYTKETFCEKYNYDRNRAHTIYIAVQNRFHEEEKGIIGKLGLENSDYIIYPANFWEHKNHRILLNAFTMYAHKNHNAKLVLTGNTLDREAYYRDVIEKLGIRDNVVITGYLENDELYSVLKNSKGLVFPSLFEGFGIPVVEAMHIHKLIACSNVTSLPEIGCESIHYFNPKKPDSVLEGIQYLFETEITEEIIQEYSKKLERFDSDRMIQEYLEVFKKIISGK